MRQRLNQFKVSLFRSDGYHSYSSLKNRSSMQRYGSKASLAGSTTSRMNGTIATHVIMQSDADGRGVIQYGVLPMENLVNFGRPPKMNDIVTYKADLRSRGTSRGKIILFGEMTSCSSFDQSTQIRATRMFRASLHPSPHPPSLS